MGRAIGSSETKRSLILHGGLILRRRRMQLRTTAKLISGTMLSSAIAAALGVGPSYAAQDANEMAIVENVSGQVVAFLAGKTSPTRSARCGQRWNSIRPPGE